MALVVFWFIAVLLAFHFGSDLYPPGVPVSLLVDLVLLILIGVSAWGLGSALLSPLKLADDSPHEAPVFELGAGLGGLALIVFVVAATGLLYRPVVIAILGGCVSLLARRLKAGAFSPRAPRTAAVPRLSRAEVLLAALPVAAGLVTLAGALAPPEFYDALIYHLAVPDLYVRHHGMVPVPGNYYASLPANMGMLYAVGLLIRGGGLAQSLHWLCGAAAAVALLASAGRHTDRTTALLACAVFALTPGVMLISTYAIADLGVTLFGTLCFAAVLNLWRGGGRRWLITAGIFAGLALGTKLTAAAVVCAPAAAAIALRPGRSIFGQDARRALAGVALFAGIALLLLVPWLARNLAFTGNPLAPYFGATGSPGITDEMSRRLPSGAGPIDLAMHYVSAPWSVTMKRLGAGGYLGPVFLMFVPLLILMRGLPPVVAPAALMAGLGLAGWAAMSQVTRYLLPVLPLFALLAAVAARRLHRLVSCAALGWALAYNALIFFILIETTGNYRVVAGAETPESYLSRRVTYYPAVAFLNDAPLEAKVLFVGEGRGYYCPRAYAATTPFDAPLLDRYAASAANEEAIVAALRADGFTHMLVSDPELRRTRNITADDLMKRFFPSGGLRLLFERNGVRIYGLAG